MGKVSPNRLAKARGSPPGLPVASETPGGASMLTAAISKSSGEKASYSLCMDGISSRQGAHQVAQMFSSTTLPR